MTATASSSVRNSDLLAGLGDAGFASLGTFLTGVVAVRGLPAHSLALYVVLGSATVFSMPLPRQLAYFPAQLGANLQPDYTSPVIRNSVRGAVRPSLLACLIVLISGATLFATVEPAQLIALTLTATAFTVLSPLQDHVRGALHVCGRHGSAAICSIVLAMTIGVILILTLILHLPPVVVAAIPFGALVLGNLASLIIGVLLLRGADRHVTYGRSTLGERSRYLGIELIVQGCWFACNYAILLILGAGALANLETARISASPILILAAGVSTFMVAALLRQISSADQDGARARGLLLRAFAIVVGGAAIYAIVLTVALPAVSQVLNRPVNLALALTRIAAFAFDGCASLMSAVLLAIGASKAALLTSVGAGVIGLAGTAALAPVIGPIALPVAQGVGMATRLGVSVRVGRDRFR